MGFFKDFPSLYGGRWIASPDSFGYRGEAPFSENETTAVKNFVEQHLINISLSYHTYGEFITYPWTDNSGGRQMRNFLYLSEREFVVLIIMSFMVLEIH